MYGLTESFRSAYLPPEELLNRVNSIGKAVPGVELLVLDENLEPCPPGVVGELYHRGLFVNYGYLNNPELTNRKYIKYPGSLSGAWETKMVKSGDFVKLDNEGFIYYVGRMDEQLKVSGFRISPNEIEEFFYTQSYIKLCAAIQRNLSDKNVLVLYLESTKHLTEIELLQLQQEYDKLKIYDTSNMYVNLSGFVGDLIGNIPTKFLNSTHRIYFTQSDSTDILINIKNSSNVVEKITGFYILLPEIFSTNIEPVLNINDDKDLKIDIIFHYIGGIPINILNADIPITNSNIFGYHTIYSTTKDVINIKLSKDTHYINKTDKHNPELGQIPINFGGDDVFISKITEIEGGYSNPNNYVIELTKSIKNIFSVKLINSIFPNTSSVFKKTINNKIYWQNLEDGEHVYNAEITEGSYRIDDLIKELETKMYNVKRIGISDNIINGYINKIKFKISIDANTNITTIISYKEARLRAPIVDIKDLLGNAPSLIATISGNPPYLLKINHPNHGLNVNDEIIFEGFVTTMGISNDILNALHVVSNIIDSNTYEIIIDNFNLTYVRIDEKGGFSAKVFVKNKFKLLFDKNDTIGTQMGFRNVGNDIAITDFSEIITNNVAYLNEIVTLDQSTNIKYVYESSGKLIKLENNALQLNGDDYVLMVIKEFGGCENIGKDKKLIEYFAKINFSQKYGENMFDTFVNAPILFYDMLTLNAVNISFYDKNGKLFDFYGMDHSFVLEVTMLNLLPQETGLNSTNNFF